MDRRQFIAGSMAAGLGAGLGGLLTAGAAGGAPARPVDLRVQAARYPILETVTEGMVSLSPDAPPPVLKVRQGHVFSAAVTNATPDHTAMHWHGIRVPNEMDGVPYLTQVPIGGNETFQYSFTPQDAGTFWYHPHCMTMEQMALGLTGVLVVEEEEDPGFDADIAINLRDFRLGGDGQFIDLYTARGAARGGTRGTVITANWKTELIETVPAGGLVRLRLVATDTTRIYSLAVAGAEGRVIALDGHPLSKPRPLPDMETPLVLSPGQRADLALHLSGSEGHDVTISTRVGGRARPVARIRPVGGDRKRSFEELRPLPRNPISEPDLANAERHDLVFGWSPDGTAPNNGFCGTMGYTFWSINRIPWPGDAAKGTGPLVNMSLGKSYILRLRNESPNQHPIHLHGLTFKALQSNQRAISPHWTDTILLLKNEIVDIAVAADNPGDWAFHCHVIEHQKTGLAGYIRVS